DIPEFLHEGVRLRLVHPDDFAQAPRHIRFGAGAERARRPYAAEPFIQRPRLQVETLLPPRDHRWKGTSWLMSVGRDFQHPADIKDNRSNGQTCSPFTGSRSLSLVARRLRPSAQPPPRRHM